MSRPIRVLELRSVRGTGGGPEKTILLGAAQADPARFAVTVCYLRDARDASFGVTDRADRRRDRLRRSDRAALVRLAGLDRAAPTCRRAINRYRPRARIQERCHRVGVGEIDRGRPSGDGPRLDRPLVARAMALLSVRQTRARQISAADRRFHRHTRRARSARRRPVADYDRAEWNRRSSLSARPIPSKRKRARRSESRLDDVVIGAVGRLEPQKRFDLLLNAFAALKTRHPRLRLVIVGDGSRRASLEAQCHALQLNGSCLLTGHIADVRLPHYAFNLFAQSSDYEGTPNAVLEAMALETPVVATDAGGTRELVEHGIDGLIVPTGERARARRPRSSRCSPIPRGRGRWRRTHAGVSRRTCRSRREWCAWRPFTKSSRPGVSRRRRPRTGRYEYERT